MIEAAGRRETPDPADGIRAKQRSVHNTYFTLPVLFVMTSTHYAMTFGHEYNWLVLVAISLVGALIRVYFVARHSGKASILPLVAAVLIIVAMAIAMAPKSRATTSAALSLEQIRPVIEHRCVTCHSAQPTHIAFPAAPAGVMFDSEEQILADASRIYQQTVVTRAMPIGNLTGISEEERLMIDAWYLGIADSSND